MSGLRSDVNPLAGGALVACAAVVEGTSVAGAGGRAAADLVGGYQAGPESRAGEVADTRAAETGRLSSACFPRVVSCRVGLWARETRRGGRPLSSEPVIHVRDGSTTAVPSTGRGARGSGLGFACADGFAEFLDAA
jgi:hypothetical protein